jgi:hypothetical protein
MTDTNQKDIKIINPKPAPQKKPDDCGTISVAGFLRIFDPKTKETYVETRG